MSSANLPSGVGVSVQNATIGGNLTISGVTVQNILPAQRPPLWVNVPRLPPRFVGRDALVDQLVELLQSGSPSAAVHGLPGAGKSALAVVLAHHPALLAHFSDGVLWAGLGPTPDVMSLLAAWGDALGVDVTDKPTVELRSQAVANAIGQQKLLLVLDDAWQIEPAQYLRCGGPNCAHLLTSRDLGLARVFAGDRRRAFVAPELADEPACALLREIAPEAWAADPAQAAQLAAGVGGLPLALELVGAFLAAPERSLFPQLAQAALGEMADPARRLAQASVRLGTVDGKQVSLQETIALSLAYLPQSAVSVFHALGAFAPRPAGFDLAAAQAVAQAVTEADAATLATLVARSLVEQAGPETLALHQVVADVARGALPPEAAACHREYYLGQVNENRQDWQRIEGLYSQVQWAWQRAVTGGAAVEEVLILAEALRIYQQRRGLWQDRLAWYEHALELARAAGRLDDVSALLTNIGKVHDDLGDKPRALAYYEQALLLDRQLEDKSGEATDLNNIGAVYHHLGDKSQALAYYEQALPLRRQVGDRAGEAATLNNMGAVYDDLGDKQQALVYYEQALPLRRQVGDRTGEATTLNNLAFINYQQGQIERSAETLAQAVDLFRETGAAQDEAACLYNLALVYKALRTPERATACLTRSIALLEQHQLDRDSAGVPLAEHRRLLAELTGKE